MQKGSGVGKEFLYKTLPCRELIRVVCTGGIVPSKLVDKIHQLQYPRPVYLLLLVLGLLILRLSHHGHPSLRGGWIDLRLLHASLLQTLCLLSLLYLGRSWLLGIRLV